MSVHTNFISKDVENYEEPIAEIIMTEIKRLIPSSLKLKLPSRSFRNGLLEKFGEDAFLNPDKLKYPVMDESGNINQGLVKAAYMRARQLGETDIAHRAKELMHEHGEVQVLVDVEGHEEVYEIGQLMDILELDFSTINKQQNIKTVFRDPEGQIIIAPGDEIKWIKEDGTDCIGKVKEVNDGIALVDVDGSEETVKL